VTQNLVREEEVLVISMTGKKGVACVLLRKNFQNGVLVHSITKIPLDIYKYKIRRRGMSFCIQIVATADLVYFCI
jgi:hypothetical protein